MATHTLTPKQTQVIDLLKRGRSVAQIAKTMKISESGVYGHIRRLKEAGVDVPGQASANAGAASPPPVKPADQPVFNGEPVEVDVPTVIRTQIKTAQEQIAEVEREATAMAERAKTLQEHKERLVASIERHDAALAAYEVK